jgi:hypothetical protein
MDPDLDKIVSGPKNRITRRWWCSVMLDDWTTQLRKCMYTGTEVHIWLNIVIYDKQIYSIWSAFWQCYRSIGGLGGQLVSWKSRLFAQRQQAGRGRLIPSLTNRLKCNLSAKLPANSKTLAPTKKIEEKIFLSTLLTLGTRLEYLHWTLRAGPCLLQSSTLLQKAQV